MPVADSFIGTNILLYAISTEPSETAKTEIARQLTTTANWGWSAQVAAEFVNSSTAKRRPAPLTLAEAGQWIETWLPFPMAPLAAATVKDAIAVAQRFQIAYFDAQIIAAAKQLVCGTLYSEDLNQGQVYDGVKVITLPDLLQHHSFVTHFQLVTPLVHQLDRQIHRWRNRALYCNVYLPFLSFKCLLATYGVTELK